MPPISSGIFKRDNIMPIGPREVIKVNDDYLISIYCDLDKLITSDDFKHKRRHVREHNVDVYTLYLDHSLNIYEKEKLIHDYKKAGWDGVTLRSLDTSLCVELYLKDKNV